MNVAQTISEITRKHLTENNGVAMGQCLTAVGRVAGTVPDMPDHPNLIERSMDDTCSSGIAVGYALAGRRPIFICRYQGFMHFNQTFFTNFASKAKEIWGYKVPVFIRAVAMEGSIGPVAGSSHHGMITRMPGISVCAPMTPGEYENVWKYFMEHDNPLYVSEHRRSFAIDYEFTNTFYPHPDLTIIAISSARLNAFEAMKKLLEKKVFCNLVHLVWLKPLGLTPEIIEAVRKSRFGGLIVDTDFEDGYSKCIAYELMHKTNKKVWVLGLEERTAGFAPHLDNLPPTPQKIFEFVANTIRESLAEG